MTQAHGRGRAGRRARRAAQRDQARQARQAQAIRKAGPPRAAPEQPETSGESAIFKDAPRRALLPLGLAALAIIPFLPALWAGFVWDDLVFTDEPAVLKGSGLWTIWTAPRELINEGHYWPIVYTSLWLEHKLWGLEPFGFHLVNLLLHAANVTLIWRLMLRLGVPGAWAMAAVFAVHPVHVEAVVWIIARKDLLATLFSLSAALVWLRFVDKPGRARYALALGLYIAALLSKSVAVTLPAALLIWHWFKRGRVAREDLIRLAPFFAAGLAIIVADYLFYVSRESVDFGFSALERLLLAARALWFYAGKLLWPAELAVIYPKWEAGAASLPSWLLAAAAAAAVALLWGMRHRWGRGPLAGAAFFAVSLSPVLGFIDFGYMQFSFVADRYQYFASLGVIVVLVGGAAHAARRLRARERRLAAGCLAGLLAVLGALSWQQSGIYRNEFAFFGHIIALNPEARGAHLNLGRALINAGRTGEGYEMNLIAAQRQPDDARAHNNLGIAALNMQRFDDAERHLFAARELTPDNPDVLQNLAELRRQQGRHEEAVEFFRQLAEQRPDSHIGYTGLGLSLHALGRYGEAIEMLDRALALEPPGQAVLQAQAGRALQALGRYEDAERRFELALQGAFDRAQAPLMHVDLAQLYRRQSRFDEAQAELRRAFSAAQGSRDALQAVAERLRELGNHAEAVEVYRAALELDSAFASAYGGMGDALFRLQRYDETIDALERSLALQPVSPTALARLLLRGDAARELGRDAQAAESYEQALALAPDSVQALDRLAFARFQEGRPDDALGLYRRLAELQPTAHTYANIGVTLASMDRLEEALAGFERALSLDPQNEVALANIPQIRATLGARSD